MHHLEFQLHVLNVPKWTVCFSLFLFLTHSSLQIGHSNKIHLEVQSQDPHHMIFCTLYIYLTSRSYVTEIFTYI